MRTPVSKLIPGMQEAIADITHRKEDVLTDIYFAGHFDGEGCLSFRRETRSTAPGLTARVSSVYKPTILEYKSYFGGSVKAVSHNSVRIGHSARLQWLWSLSGMVDLIRFVNRLLPHMKEKRNQFELAKEYLLDRLQLFKGGDSSPPQNVESLISEMSRLKQFEYAN